jgi:REP element-mobilizing transposase RayT
VAGTYTKLCYHIVFSTKNRAGYITPSIEDELHKHLGGIVHGLDGLSVEVNGMPDHVHILAILPPKIAVLDALRVIKTNSSKWVRDSKREFAMFG